MFRRIWRDKEQWSAEELPINSSSSNEAVKLFDASLTQLVGWYDDPQENGIGSTLERMVKADPEFILGRALSLGVNLIGTGVTIRHDSTLNNELAELKALCKKRKSNIEWREAKHVDAVDLFAHGNMNGAAKIWEEILVKHPTDMMAIKFAHDTYFYLGESAQIRDSIERIYPIWQKQRPLLHAYIHGMYAFGLEETLDYEKAEKTGRRGLELMPNDPWAVHALAHVYEMTERQTQGLEFVSSTVKDWEMCNYLACHNFWHWALYHIEKDETEAASELFEKEIQTRALKSGNILDIVDACSLLYRLDLLYPRLYSGSGKWIDMYELCKPHHQDHILGFNDIHYSMAYLAVEKIDKAEDLLLGIRSMEDSIADHWVPVTTTILEAMIDFKREKYSTTVEKLNKVKSEIVKIGGSNAQRDVFDQLHLIAALKSNNTELAKSLIEKRAELRGKDVVVRLVNDSRFY